MQPGISDRYRDSIKSSDTYYVNPYREDFDYRRAERARAVKNLSLDRLESTQERIERELLEKILAKKSKITPASFILLGQLGKFLFVALMLPPYVVFYGMPKLVFKKLAVIASTTASQVGSYLSKFAATSSLYLNKIYTWPLNKIRFLSSKVKELFNQIALQTKQKIFLPAAHFANKQKDKITGFLKKLSIPVKQFYGALFSRIHGYASQVWKKVKNLPIPSLSIPLPRTFFKNLSNKFNRLRIKCSEAASIVKKKIQEAVAFSWKMIETSWLFLWQPISQLKLPQYRLPSMTRIKEFYSNALRTVTHLTQSLMNIFAKGFTKGREASKKLSAKMAYQLNKLKDGLSKQAAKAAKFITSKWRSLKHFASAFAKKWAHLPGKLKEKWLKAQEKTKTRVYNFLLTYFQKIKRIANRLFIWVKKVLLLAGSFFINVFLAMRILYAVICLFFKFTIQGIKDRFSQEM